MYITITLNRHTAFVEDEISVGDIFCRSDIPAAAFVVVGKSDKTTFIMLQNSELAKFSLLSYRGIHNEYDFLKVFL